MPELPEVETVRRDLEDRILNKKITTVVVTKERLIKSDPAQFTTILTGNSFTSIERRGKLLILTLKDDKHLLLWHLKMTGQIIYKHGGDTTFGGHPYPAIDSGLPNKYSYVIFTFADGSQVFFNDQRQFGYLQIIDLPNRAGVEKKYGAEPLSDDFTLAYLINTLKRRSKAAIKAVLLDQKAIAGIGNIYADESCFEAKVRPQRKVSTLSPAEIKRLHSAIKQVLLDAVALRGTTFRNYKAPDGKNGSYSDKLQVYGRKGKPCLRCKKGIIQKTTVAGRGTCYCNNCQK